MQIIIFNVNGKYFGLNTENIEEITRKTSITNVPNAPYGVEGLTNIRGDVIPLISLSKLLHLEEDVCYNNVIIIKNTDYKTGILINEILKVIEIEESGIEQLGFETERGIKGILQLEDIIVNIIDINDLLAKNEGLN
ncbi:MAG: chemotaxis protein CheW [Gudongella sp.]|nr:chemotaxis protein CheW [Gudongella sp.]